MVRLESLSGLPHKIWAAMKDSRMCAQLFSWCAAAQTQIYVRYDTDYEERYDLTTIRAYAWKLSPRDLSYRHLGGQKYAHVERREPQCRNIKHFSMRLENNIAGAGFGYYFRPALLQLPRETDNGNKRI